jgi:hypothetical protein
MAKAIPLGDVLTTKYERDRIRRRKAKEKTPKKFHRRCWMAQWYEAQGLSKHTYCKGDFDTDDSRKITCCVECSYDKTHVRRTKHKEDTVGAK